MVSVVVEPLVCGVCLLCLFLVVSAAPQRESWRSSPAACTTECRPAPSVHEPRPWSAAPLSTSRACSSSGPRSSLGSIGRCARTATRGRSRRGSWPSRRAMWEPVGGQLHDRSRGRVVGRAGGRSVGRSVARSVDRSVVHRQGGCAVGRTASRRRAHDLAVGLTGGGSLQVSGPGSSPWPAQVSLSRFQARRIRVSGADSGERADDQRRERSRLSGSGRRTSSSPPAPEKLAPKPRGADVRAKCRPRFGAATGDTP